MTERERFEAIAGVRWPCLLEPSDEDSDKLLKLVAWECWQAAKAEQAASLSIDIDSVFQLALDCGMKAESWAVMPPKFAGLWTEKVDLLKFARALLASHEHSTHD